MSDRPKATSIVIHWDDGSESSAEGQDAAKVMEWYNNCEMFCRLRGHQYTGPNMARTKATGTANASHEPGPGTPEATEK